MVWRCLCCLFVCVYVFACGVLCDEVWFVCCVSVCVRLIIWLCDSVCDVVLFGFVLCVCLCVRSNMFVSCL